MNTRNFEIGEDLKGLGGAGTIDSLAGLLLAQNIEHQYLC